MKTLLPLILLIFVFTSCSREDNLEEQTNTGNTGGVQLAELVFYSDSSFSGTGTDSVAYRVDYTGSAITRMTKVRQHPTSGGVNLYENLADSILFTYSGGKLAERNVYKAGSLVKKNTYTYSGSSLTQDQELTYGPSASGTVNHFYSGGNRNHDYGVFSYGLKDSAYYGYNGNNDVNSVYGYYNYGSGWNQYGFTLTHTTQANALRSLVNNDELLSVMLGGQAATTPSGFVPDSLTMAYGGVFYYKKKVVQQISSGGYMQRMINYYQKPFMRLANTAVKLPYVQLKYENL